MMVVTISLGFVFYMKGETGVWGLRSRFCFPVALHRPLLSLLERMQVLFIQEVVAWWLRMPRES